MGIYKDWAKCLDCGERRLVSKKEWIRAARPRCRACGGSLEPSDAANDDLKFHNDAKKSFDAIIEKKTNKK